jgi:hypothetical protein
VWIGFLQTKMLAFTSIVQAAQTVSQFIWR